MKYINPMKNSLNEIAFVLICILLVVGGCKKSNEESTAQCNPDTSYSEISIINENAEFVTTAPDDWTTDETWCPQILQMFKPDTFNLDTAYVDSARLLAFPNPVQYHLNMYVYSGQPCALQYAIVDRQNNILFRRSHMTHAGYNNYQVLDYQDVAILQTGNYYRMYYACHAKDALFFFKGHGDIYVE